MPGAEVDTQLAKGSEALKQGQIAAALQAFQAALAVHPDHPKALALLGLVYFRSGDFAAARPIFEKLVELSPQDASHRLNLGLVQLKLSDATAAVKELETSRQLDPSGRAASYLGLAYARGGRYVEAYQAFLLAGQADLAREVEANLTPVEKAAIDAHLEEVRSGRRSALPPAEGTPGAPAVPSRTDDEPSGIIKFVQPDQPGSAPEIQILSGGGFGASSAAIPVPGAGETAISRAVAKAAPAAATQTTGARVSPGSTPPMPLSEFATSRLVRPDDGDVPFEISPTGVLVVRVDGKIFARTEGVDVTGGQLDYDPATRRSRGTQTNEAFDSGGRPLFLVTGKGHLIAMPLGGVFAAVQLDDDILYLREELVFGFETQLRWENGHIPGSRSQIRMVQFRGHGAVAFRTKRPLIAVKLSSPSVLFIDAHAIAGWIGRVVPRTVKPAGGGQSALFIECSGEGVVLVEEDPGEQVAEDAVIHDVPATSAS